MNALQTSRFISRRSFATGIAATPFVAVLASHGVTAQDATPAGMSIEDTHQALVNYATALTSRGDFGQYMAEDVVAKFMDVGLEVSGRQASVEGITALHTMQFDAQPELTSMVVGEGVAAVEAIFVATHTGEFAGIPATGMAVSVPYAVFLSFKEGLVAELRLYGPISGLMAQVSGNGGSGAATPAT